MEEESKFYNSVTIRKPVCARMGGVHDLNMMHSTDHFPLSGDGCAARFPLSDDDCAVCFQPSGDGCGAIARRRRATVAGVARGAAVAVALLASAAAAREPGALSRWRSPREAAAPATMAPAVAVKVESDRPALASDMPESAVVRVTLSGVPPAGGERAAVNLAIVLDASADMRGAFFGKARDAALEAIARLGPRDAVSVVAFGERARVLVAARPAGAGAEDAAADALRGIVPDGAAAPFAGVAAGAAELRKNASRGLVNRLVLVSAGGDAAGSGPDGAFALLGASLAKEGIAVSAAVAGSDGEAAAALARASGGEARFAAEPEALPGLVAEALDDAFCTVARDASVRIRFRDAFPVALEEGDGRIEEGVVSVRLGPVAAGRDKSVLVRTEFPAGRDGETREFARAEATWTRTDSGANEAAEAVGRVSFAVDPPGR